MSLKLCDLMEKAKDKGFELSADSSEEIFLRPWQQESVLHERKREITLARLEDQRFIENPKEVADELQAFHN